MLIVGGKGERGSRKTPHTLGAWPLGVRLILSGQMFSWEVESVSLGVSRSWENFTGILMVVYIIFWQGGFRVGEVVGLKINILSAVICYVMLCWLSWIGLGKVR